MLGRNTIVYQNKSVSSCQNNSKINFVFKSEIQKKQKHLRQQAFLADFFKKIKLTRRPRKSQKKFSDSDDTDGDALCIKLPRL